MYLFSVLRIMPKGTFRKLSTPLRQPLIHFSRQFFHLLFTRVFHSFSLLLCSSGIAPEGNFIPYTTHHCTFFLYYLFSPAVLMCVVFHAIPLVVGDHYQGRRLIAFNNSRIHQDAFSRCSPLSQSIFFSRLISLLANAHPFSRLSSSCFCSDT